MIEMLKLESYVHRLMLQHKAFDVDYNRPCFGFARSYVITFLHLWKLRTLAEISKNSFKRIRRLLCKVHRPAVHTTDYLISRFY